MTSSELKEKISQSASPDWFNHNVETTISFPYIQFTQTFNGLPALYEFVQQQVDGWKNHGELPGELKHSLKYFETIATNLIQFVHQNQQHNVNVLANNWKLVRQFVSKTNTFPLPYHYPEVDFLLTVSKDFGRTLPGAFNFIVGNIQNPLSDKNTIIGSLLAYEFTLKDHTGLSQRREIEKKSINTLRNEFLNYLNKSEAELTSYLSTARENLQSHIRVLEDLKIAKEKHFDDWFKRSEYTFKSFSETSTKNVEDLERTYEELLRLKKPAEYWRQRAIDLKKEGWRSLYWLIALVVVPALALYALLWLTPDGMLRSFFNDDRSLALRWTIIFITFLFFFVFGIQAIKKVTFSAFHLARDAEERERLTYVYLAMVKDSSIDKEDRHLIMQSLFSRADTGLLKDDSSPVMPGASGMFERLFNK
ncbi:MAG TPA: DUF6161 domain-containing protein [Ohtaekwangia sp.]|nr:DUF6161 domain-containing protein [Ohtaekwangia sp.]